jgi:hypothetical protein
MKNLFDMTAEEIKIHLFKLLPKVLLASIPDNISDNDPLLIERMQSVYDKWRDDFKTHFSGTDISCLEIEGLKELRHKLTEFPSMHHSRADRIKVNRLLQFLATKEKEISIITPALPQWSQRLVALYCYYSDFAITEGNRIEMAASFGISGSSSLVNAYNTYMKKQNRIFSEKIDADDRRIATEQLKQLQELRILMEDRGEKNISKYTKLLFDIEALKKNLKIL